MKNKAPAFQFYVKDFLVDTAHMTNEQVGIYIKLLCYAWTGTPGCQQTEIPTDVQRLLKLVSVSPKKWDKISEEILGLFVESRSGFLKHKRLAKELGKQKKRSRQARQAGKRSAEERKKKASERSTTVATDAQPKPNSSSASSPSSSIASSSEEGERAAEQIAVIYQKAADGKPLTPFPSAVLEFKKALGRGANPEKLKTEAAAGGNVRAWEIVKKVIGNGNHKSVKDIVLDPKESVTKS